MNGTESKDDHARCDLWDTIFVAGPQSVPDLAEEFRLSQGRVNELVDHPWFKVKSNRVFIAMADGSVRSGFKMSKAG